MQAARIDPVQAARTNAKLAAVRADIGPNAVTQLIAALSACGLGDRADTIFSRAGTAEWLTNPPGEMVNERRVARLHQTLRAELPSWQAAAVLSQAGRLTADYLLRVRIPRPARFLLRHLPPPLAAGVLVPAIRAHAWTFAGSGRLQGRAGSPTVFELSGNPLCAGETASAPTCTWHAAVFQRLFAVLVAPAAEVAETHCEACGYMYCRFTLRW